MSPIIIWQYLDIRKTCVYIDIKNKLEDTRKSVEFREIKAESRCELRKMEFSWQKFRVVFILPIRPNRSFISAFHFLYLNVNYIEK